MADDDATLRQAAEAGDGEAMFRLATALEAEARQLEQQAREWFERSSDAHSLDGLNAEIRFAVADRDYDRAQYLLRCVPELHPDAAPDRCVSVAPEVLRGEATPFGDVLLDSLFTIIVNDPVGVAPLLAPIAPQLMAVDGLGGIQALAEDGSPLSGEEIFTPKFLFGLELCNFGVKINLDTEDGMPPAMGRTMVSILVDGLAQHRVPAHITGFLPDLQLQMRLWDG